MNDYLQFADDARRLLRGFVGIDRAAAAFEHVGSVEQAGVEAQAKLDDINAQIAKAADDLVVASAAVRAVQAHADELKTQSEKVLAQSQADAQAGLDKATADGAVLVAQAQAQAQAVRVSSDEQAAVAAEAYAAISIRTADLQQQYDSLRAQINKFKDIAA